MALVQGGQAEAAVPAGVFGVADADQGDLQQADGGGQHLVAARSAPRQIVVDPLP
ncbi:hypothetical protein D3C80_2082370 [compost metagenome]